MTRAPHNKPTLDMANKLEISLSKSLKIGGCLLPQQNMVHPDKYSLAEFLLKQNP